MTVHPIGLIIGWILDKLLGDPLWLPHPVVGFGKMIAVGEKRLNKGNHRRMKGGIMAVFLIILTYIATWGLLNGIRLLFHLQTSPIIVEALLIFLCLAGTTLCQEVNMVFEAADHSLEAGRKQVARIVGRDTSQLTDQEIRKAALETLAENLSDGVIAPLFWLLLLGVPGMMTYKMVNTLDSMIGYRTKRYKDFGMIAARIDDVANWIPARFTSILMILVAGKPKLFRFVYKFGPKHASPNSGWPEAALAGILNCQFGGTHIYFGETIEKPYIGDHDRKLKTKDMKKAIRINQMAETLMVIIVFLISILL